jgi:cell fate regulator YaaT (PSP1 superfamily)
VFLEAAADVPWDDATAIDMTPWEASIAFGDVEGTLYNTVTVRGLRGHRSREYDAGDSVFAPGDLIAVEGESGSAGLGTVVRPNRRQVVRGRLPRVLRRAQASELSVETRDKRREQEVYRIARHVTNALNLPIKIVRAQAEPNGKTVVFFASEDRIDFRELFRRVSAAAQGRVELRQLGVRDAAKMLGGVAPCGLQLCCTSFLREFAPVSIKMAKEQGLVLNPQRVSGLCGRLLCCLTYEDALYRAQRKLLPKLGKRVLTPRGPGKVRDVDVLAQTIRISLETGEIVTMTPADITPMFPSQRGQEQGSAPQERDTRQQNATPSAGVEVPHEPPSAPEQFPDDDDADPQGDDDGPPPRISRREA